MHRIPLSGIIRYIQESGLSGFETCFNKPRTAKVGAISKAQNLKGGPFGLCETPAGCKKFLNCKLQKNCKKEKNVIFQMHYQ